MRYMRELEAALVRLKREIEEQEEQQQLLLRSLAMADTFSDASVIDRLCKENAELKYKFYEELSRLQMGACAQQAEGLR